MYKLDKADRKILRLLQQDGRMTIKELANKLHLTNTPVYERVKKLEKNGVIEKYMAILNPEKLDRSMVVFMNVSLAKHTKDVVEAFKESVLDMPEVMEFHYISGDFDSHLKIMVKDMEEFKIFIEEKLSGLEYVTKFQSSFVISSANKTAFSI